jgi:hypothetical protein
MRIFIGVGMLSIFGLSVLVGCATIDKPKINSLTKYHHQLLLNGRMIAEGYFYRTIEKDGYSYFLYSQGNSYDCNGGDRFVLDRSIKIIKFKGASGIKASDKDLYLELGDKVIRGVKNEQVLLEKSLPLPTLFDSEGCKVY